MEPATQPDGFDPLGILPTLLGGFDPNRIPHVLPPIDRATATPEAIRKHILQKRLLAWFDVIAVCEVIRRVDTRVEEIRREHMELDGQACHGQHHCG